MKATIDGTVIAEAADDDLITIEGNYYFPPSSLTSEAFSDSPTPYTCPWKGVCQYHDVAIGGDNAPRCRLELPRALPGLVRPGREGLLRLRRVR